jgi:signal transduction histidine kinase
MKHFRVSLNGASDRIQLKVKDSGVGFEPEKAVKGWG